MTYDEFNIKYSEYLEEGHYGLAIHFENIVSYLDALFQKLILKPNFSYRQIKLKFGYARVYVSGLTEEEVLEIESEIDRLVTIYHSELN